MKKARKFLLLPAKILIPIWIFSFLLTKCGDMDISYDIDNVSDKIPEILKNEAVKSRDYLPFPEYLQPLVKEIENDSTYPNLQNFFFNLRKSQIFLTITYNKDSGTLCFDSMSDNFIPMDRIIRFRHSRVSVIEIISAINEFKEKVLDANHIKYSGSWLNYLTIYMALFDDYQFHGLVLIILLLSFYINYCDAVNYTQYQKYIEETRKEEEEE